VRSAVSVNMSSNGTMPQRPRIAALSRPGAPERVPSRKLDCCSWSALREREPGPNHATDSGSQAQCSDLRECSTLRLRTRSGAPHKPGFLSFLRAGTRQARRRSLRLCRVIGVQGVIEPRGCPPPPGRRSFSWPCLYDTRGAVAAHACTAHCELAGELLRNPAGSPTRLDLGAVAQQVHPVPRPSSSSRSRCRRAGRRCAGPEQKKSRQRHISPPGVWVPVYQNNL
jgi:hypothetical protein